MQRGTWLIAVLRYNRGGGKGTGRQSHICGESWPCRACNVESNMIPDATMKRRRPNLKLPRNGVTESLALVTLLVMGAFAVAGPSGVLAWSENERMLEERQKEVAVLTADRDRLQNRVNLLDPRHADPDLVGELLRSDLNVAHPDELVIPRQPR